MSNQEPYTNTTGGDSKNSSLSELFAKFPGLKDVNGRPYPQVVEDPSFPLDKRWKVYDPSTAERDWGFEIITEDICILTEEGYEVVGCSEWMRADREVFDHIVNLHNQSFK